MIRRALIGMTLLLVSCSWEVNEVESGEIELYVQEARFRAVKPGTAANDVTKAIGAPREKQQGLQETWHYGVWRGEEPGFLKWLFSRRTPPATLLEGRIHFASGRVTRVEVIESSAVTWPAQTTD